MKSISKKLSIVGLAIVAAVILFAKLDLNTYLNTYLNNDLNQSSGQVQGRSQRKEEGLLEVIFFDVGQGDSALINTPRNRQILVDGGPDNAVLEKLAHYLDFNDRYIDIVVLTHPHADHVDGLVSVLKRYEVGEVWMTGVVHTLSKYLEFLNLIKEKNIRAKIIYACSSDKQQDIDIIGEPGCTDEIILEPNIKISFLWPVENLTGRKVDNLNNSSITFRLKHSENYFLFTGDIEKEAEYGIIEHRGDYIQSNVLKVAHHGSSVSSIEEFLDLVNPDYAVISVGQDNQFGHPSLRVIRRLERMSVPILRTDLNGDIIFISNGSNLISKLAFDNL
ncbi:MAG: MBL fold metallo-hydrolase [Candidatus Kuenenbacteria bacterium]